MAWPGGELPPPVDRMAVASPAPCMAGVAGMSEPIVITITIWPDTEQGKFECTGCDGDEALEWLAGFVATAYADPDDDELDEIVSIN